MDDKWAHVFYLIRPIIVEIERTLIPAGYFPAILPTFCEFSAENTIARILANSRNDTRRPRATSLKEREC